ncbi:class I SAM-dependent methyltransferase [Desulfofundulus sp.]|uniref:class I SAM-dependent methyltransferase n=1 Tax=Desulfofundulus sp. TaxID=2282750 RepID=UPI003C7608DF
MGDAHRDYFNQKAAIWDNLLTGETLERLKEIIGELAIKPGSFILDAGTGTGVLLPFLVEAAGPEGKVVALDIAEEMLARARAKNPEHVEFVLADISCTPFQEDTFDEIICNSCFPHVSDKPRALVEMARILKPGGRLVICHTMSREAINDLHRSLGGVVANDIIPDDDEMRELCRQCGLVEIEIINTREKYVLKARKPILTS